MIYRFDRHDSDRINFYKLFDRPPIINNDILYLNISPRKGGPYIHYKGNYKNNTRLKNYKLDGVSYKYGILLISMGCKK